MWLTWKSWNSWFPPLYWSTNKKQYFLIKIYSLYCCQTAVFEKGFVYIPPFIHLFVNLKSVRKKIFQLRIFFDFSYFYQT